LINKDAFNILGRRDVYLCTHGDRVALILWLRHKSTGKHFVVANTHLSFPHNKFDRLNQVRQMQMLTEAMDMFAKQSGIKRSTRMIMGDFNVESESPVCDHLRDLGYYSAFEVKPPSWRDPSDPQGRMKDATPAAPQSDDSGIAVVKEACTSNQRTSVRIKDESELSSSHRTHCEAECAKRRECLDDADCELCEGDEERCDTINSRNNYYFAPQFVSHRTHRREDLGVDHIFICPENSGGDGIDSSEDAEEMLRVSERLSTQILEKILLHEHQETVISPGDGNCDFFGDKSSRTDRESTGFDVLPRGAAYYTSEELDHLNNAQMMDAFRRTHGLSPDDDAGAILMNKSNSKTEGRSDSDDAQDKKLFVSCTSVLPANLPLDKWDESFDISDHRPVQASIVIAAKKKSSPE
jgi:hypothetical protein